MPQGPQLTRDLPAPLVPDWASTPARRGNIPTPMKPVTPVGVSDLMGPETEELLRRGTPLERLGVLGSNLYDFMAGKQEYDTLDTKTYKPRYMTTPKSVGMMPFFPEEEGLAKLGSSFARAGGGRIKLGIDIVQAGHEMGTGLYKQPSDWTITKELMQNAIDATRGRVGGVVHVNTQYNNLDRLPHIEVHDNGLGMTQSQLETVFTDLHSSGKRAEAGASGGKGVAKASFLLNVNKNTTKSIVGMERAIEDRLGLLRKIEDPAQLKMMNPDDRLFFSNPEEREYIRGQVRDLQNWQRDGASHVQYNFESTPEQLMGEGSPPIEATPLYAADKPQTGTHVIAELPSTADLGVYGARGFLSQSMRASKDLPSIIHTVEVPQGKYIFNVSAPTIEQAQGAVESKDLGKFYPHQYVSSLHAESPNTASISKPYADITFHWSDTSGMDERMEPTAHILNNGMFQFDSRPGGYEKIRHVPKHLIADIRPKIEEGLTGYPFTTNREALNNKIQDDISEWYNKNIREGAMKAAANASQAQYDALKPVFGKDVLFDSGSRLTPKELQAFTNSPRLKLLTNAISDFTRDVLNSMFGKAGTDKIDKIGIMLNSTIHGINVPDPRGGKGSILINPFNFMATHGTADQTASGIAHTVLHEVAHEYSRGHSELFTRSLGELYAKYGMSKPINWSNKINDILRADEENLNLHPEFHQLLDLYSESRGRPESVPDVITSKGARSRGPKSAPGGAGEERPALQHGPEGRAEPLPPSPSTALTIRSEESLRPGQLRPYGRRPIAVNVKSFIGTQPLVSEDVKYIHNLRQKMAQVVDSHPESVSRSLGRQSTDREIVAHEYAKELLDNWRFEQRNRYRSMFGVEPPARSEWPQVQANYNIFQKDPMMAKRLPHETEPLEKIPAAQKGGISFEDLPWDEFPPEVRAQLESVKPEVVGTRDPRFKEVQAAATAKAKEKGRADAAKLQDLGYLLRKVRLAKSKAGGK